ncbi:MAG: 2-dehydropantoate 2-reductase [Desulfobulbus propionicus]|nr:MAG: 2-dehydropantoate 2-reductase [Desulfobulbus propionicus]
MRFLIYGAGALGQALGCMLSAAGHQVDLVVRQRYAHVLQQNGLKVEGIFGEFFAPPEALAVHTEVTGLTGQEYDYVLLTTKSQDTAVAVASLCALAGLRCPVASFQNGCGNIEQLTKAFGAQRTLGARVITGFQISGPATVRITVSAAEVHVGGAIAGIVPDSATILAQSINDSGLPCVAVEDVHMSLYAKLLYNCALNPLGAILEVCYGELGEHPATRRLMNQVIEETFAVIQAMGGKPPWPDAASYQKVFYSTLLPATAAHRPSMLQDLEQGKFTEVEALVGYVEQKGREYKVATPACSLFAGLVRFKQEHIAGKHR